MKKLTAEQSVSRLPSFQLKKQQVDKRPLVTSDATDLRVEQQDRKGKSLGGNWATPQRLSMEAVTLYQ